MRKFQNLKHRINYWKKALENTESELGNILKKRDEIVRRLNHLKKLEAEKNV